MVDSSCSSGLCEKGQAYIMCTHIGQTVLLLIAVKTAAYIQAQNEVVSRSGYKADGIDLHCLLKQTPPARLREEHASIAWRQRRG